MSYEKISRMPWDEAIKSAGSLGLQSLEEKLIMPNKQQPYGHIVFVTGGAGSGKGFSISNFIDSSTFKVVDVDEFKLTFLKIAERIGKYPELKGLDLKTPKDVSYLHAWVSGEESDKMAGDNRPINRDSNMDLSKQFKSNLFMQIDPKSDRKPNIIFDVTGKNFKNIIKDLTPLLGLGYDPKNIHIVWVLSNYDIAIVNNSNRDRVVPPSIMFDTHVGAAKTMSEIIKNDSNELDRDRFDGNFYTILANPKLNIKHPVSINAKERTNKKGEKYKTTVVKNFLYFTIKKQGKPIMSEDEIQKTALYQLNADPDLKAAFQTAGYRSTDLMSIVKEITPKED